MKKEIITEAMMIIVAAMVLTRAPMPSISVTITSPGWQPTPPSGGSAGEFYWAEAWRSEISTFGQYAIILGLFWAKMRYFPGGVMHL